jgi:hypothetical protein
VPPKTQTKPPPIQKKKISKSAFIQKTKSAAQKAKTLPTKSKTKAKTTKTPAKIAKVHQEKVFFDEDPQTMEIEQKTGKKSRPSNQNDVGVQKKVVSKMSSIIPVKDQTSIQKEYIKGGGTKSLDSLYNAMAHGVSAREIGLSLKEYANQTKKLTGKKKKDFMKKTVDLNVQALSSDASDSDIEEFRGNMEKAVDSSLPSKQRILHLSRAFRRRNKSSRNLLPGDRSVNRKIQQRRDMHRTKSGKQIPYIQRTMDVQDKLQQIFKYDTKEFDPIGKNSQFQTSSFDSNAKFNQ